MEHYTSNFIVTRSSKAGRPWSRPREGAFCSLLRLRLLSSPLLYSTRPFDQTTIIALTSNESRSLQKSLTLKNVKSFNDLERSFCKIILDKIHWKNTGNIEKEYWKNFKNCNYFANDEENIWMITKHCYTLWESLKLS